MMNYPLRWLFTAQTTDGLTWTQTLADRSTRFPEVMLLPAVGPETVVGAVRPGDPGYDDLRLQVERGAETVTWQGIPYHWRTYSAYTDIADYAGRGEVAWFKLAQAADPAHFVLLHLADDPARAGDMEWHCAGCPHAVEIPFALPERLWRPRFSPDVSVGERPAVRLAYGRTVTVTGAGQAAAITDVVYQIGWQLEILGETLTHAVCLRGDL